MTKFPDGRQINFGAVNSQDDAHTNRLWLSKNFLNLTKLSFKLGSFITLFLILYLRKAKLKNERFYYENVIRLIWDSELLPYDSYDMNENFLNSIWYTLFLDKRASEIEWREFLYINFYMIKMWYKLNLMIYPRI